MSFWYLARCVLILSFVVTQQKQKSNDFIAGNSCQSNKAYMIFMWSHFLKTQYHYRGMAWLPVQKKLKQINLGNNNRMS